MALSLGSPPVAVSDCRVLCCPDFPLASERQAAVQQTAYSLLYPIFFVLIERLIDQPVRQAVEFTPYMREGDFLELGDECLNTFVDWPELPIFYGIYPIHLIYDEHAVGAKVDRTGTQLKSFLKTKADAMIFCLIIRRQP